MAKTPEPTAGQAGYSGKPLATKLGVKPNFRLLQQGAPKNVLETIGELPEGAEWVGARAKELDLALVFATREADLAAGIAKLRPKLKPAGMIWACWPKQTSPLATELGEATVRATGLAAGLVDVKICAVDHDWSGLKFVIRRADRPK
jgi:hypothetical protein